ncbi:glutathione S-transferase C-terminal domain-containing protein, partial [Stutzerimonas nitrititolerans]|uniref:glutathione S-transferase C-terminal domain-containing protein n=1 Tax=Stutzerimonas nitrititolerans TaxID=2482751 RepID=UPI0028A19AF2
VFWSMVRTPAEQRDMAAVAAALEECSSLLARVDRVLAEQPYLSGAAFGMGDMPLGSFIYAWFEMPIERPELPYLQAWYQRLQERPAYQRAVMIPLT